MQGSEGIGSHDVGDKKPLQIEICAERFSHKTRSGATYTSILHGGFNSETEEKMQCLMPIRCDI